MFGNKYVVKEKKIMKFQWLNESTIVKTDDKIEIYAPGKTDFFCGSRIALAPLQ